VRGGEDGTERNCIAEFPKSLSEFLGATFSGHRIGVRALFDISYAVVEDLPGEFTEPMSDGPDSALITKPGQEAAEERLKMASLLFDGGMRACVRSLRT